jgi:hypothetical protein
MATRGDKVSRRWRLNTSVLRVRGEWEGEAHGVLYTESPSDERTNPLHGASRCAGVRWVIKAEFFSIQLIGLQHVSTSANGMDEFFAAASVNLVAQIIHVDIDDVCKRVEVLVPHMFGDHGSGKHAAGVAH